MRCLLQRHGVASRRFVAHTRVGSGSSGCSTAWVCARGAMQQGARDLATQATPTGSGRHDVARLRAGVAPAVLMVRPVCFGYNPQTAASNSFQAGASSWTGGDEAAQAAALQEFDTFAQALRDVGVKVVVLEDTPFPRTPDSIFPNNWCSLGPEGMALFPMHSPNRRDERRPSAVRDALQAAGFVAPDAPVIDLSQHEEQQRFLEGTGSLVLDRVSNVAYAAVSPRTDVDLVSIWAAQMNAIGTQQHGKDHRPWQVVPFRAHTSPDESGQRHEVYHTNVLMSVGSTLAVVCADCIDAADWPAVEASLAAVADRPILRITMDQMNAYAGNVLQLRNAANETVMAIPASAWESLDAEQREVMQRTNDHIVRANLQTIQLLGGGSARCMLMEVFCTPKE